VFEIGASLREAREARGLSLDDVRSALRFRERYLTALEEERWELLPGEAYTKGFLRTYAEFLGLNGTLYIDEYNERIATQADAAIVPESLVAAAERRGSLVTRAVVTLFLASLAIFVGTSWRPGAQPRPVLQPAAKAADIPTYPQKLPEPLPPLPVVVPKKPAPKLAVIRATTATSWFSIRVGGATGREVFRGFLAPGHALRYRLEHRLWIRIGRPRAVAITVGSRRVHTASGTPLNVLLSA
jgi:transcriptional regulator with XRE-family HTH domain